MKALLFFIALFAFAINGRAQFVYPIKADSTRLFGCDGNELIIENHTRDVKGFLYNTGNGRTVFRKGMTKVNDSLYLIGGDSLKYNAWVQNGNRFGTTGILGTLDNNHLDLYTNNAFRMRLANTGRLLLGTTTDNNRETVQLNGSMYMNGYISNFLAPSGTTSGALRLRWGTGDGVYIAFYKQASISRRAFISTPADTRPLIIYDSVGVSTGNSPRLSIGSEGSFNAKLNVLKSYTQSLDVFAAGRTLTDTTSNIDLTVRTNGNVLVGGSTDNGYKFQVMDNGKVSINSVLSRSTDQIRIGGALNATDGQNALISTIGATGGWKTMIVERDGNLGLGIGGFNWLVGSPPLRTFSNGIVNVMSPIFYYGNVNGPANSSALITTVSNTNEWIAGTSYPNGQYYYTIGTVLNGATVGNKRAPLRVAADQLVFMTGVTDVEAARFSESGNLGLGTASPSAQLHTTGSVRFAGLTNDDTQTRVLVSDANGNLYYRNASSLAMSDIPRTSLAVNGPVKAKSLTLSQTGWPDFVFDSTYRLSPLKEVEDYIRENNHLPGIPSADDIANDGLNVGTTQAALLKKIEELTLYTIDQDKKIATQKDEVDALKKEVLELRKLITGKLSK